MPRTEVVFYCDDDGSVPVLEWLEALPSKARLKCLVRIERLRELGHDLRRPEADFLRDGIHELRVSLHRVRYRLLYAFHTWEKVGLADRSKAVTRKPVSRRLLPEGPGLGTTRTVALLAHGLVKEGEVPSAEIDRAIARLEKFRAVPERHTLAEE